MNDVRWLRSRILAALSVPAIGLAGCAAHEVSSNAKGPDIAPQDAARKSLCATWKKGRSYTWCTSVQEAQKLGLEKSKLSLKCPDQLDHDKVKKALKDAKFERGHSRRTDVILLHEKTRTASNDCQQDVCCYVWATRGRGNAGREIIRGRPLLAAGTAHIAPLASGNTW